MARNRLIIILILSINLVALAEYNLEIGQVVFLPEKAVTRVVVGNEEVLSAIPVSDGVVITAKGAGTSDVLIFKGTKKKSEVFSVRFPKNEKEKALVMLESLGLVIKENDDTILIKGQVPDEGTLNYIEGLAATLDDKLEIEVVVDKQKGQKDLEKLLQSCGVKLTTISGTAILSGTVPSQQMHDGLLQLTSSIYVEAVSLMEISPDKVVEIPSLPDFTYRGVTYTDYGNVILLEGSVESEEESTALANLASAYRDKVVNLIKVKPKKAELPHRLFQDFGQLKLERASETIILTGVANSPASFSLVKQLFSSLYPQGTLNVSIKDGESVLKKWAEMLNCELINAGDLYAIKGTLEQLDVLKEIGKLYQLSVFPIIKEESALDFLRAFLDLGEAELTVFKDTLYVKNIPQEKMREFNTVAKALFVHVIYVDNESNNKEPYTVQVTGFQITESDLDQLALETKNLMKGWQEVVLNWQDLGIIRDLAREWDVKQPSVLVYPGEKASIHAGGQIPIPFEQGVEWQDFGVSLECLLGLAENGLIPGYLNLVVADLDWGNGLNMKGTSLPALKRYSYEGQVQLPQGGGVLLMRHWSKKEGLVDRSVPYLKQLPVFGPLLFGHKTKNERSQIMCVLVEVS